MLMGDLTHQANSFLVLLAEKPEYFVVLLTQVLIPHLALVGDLQLLRYLHHVSQLSVGLQGAVTESLATDRTGEVPVQFLPPAGDANTAEVVTTINYYRVFQVLQANRAAGLHLEILQRGCGSHGSWKADGTHYSQR